jgi:hypothetical protein
MRSREKKRIIRTVLETLELSTLLLAATALDTKELDEAGELSLPLDAWLELAPYGTVLKIYHYRDSYKLT